MKSNQVDQLKSGAEIVVSDRYSAYALHASVLRSWLVAYGIGALVLFLSQSVIWQALARAGSLKLVAALFLLGVFLQVALSAVNKSVMWAAYYGDITPSFRSTRIYRCADSLSNKYWIDFLVDCVSIVLFIVATYRCFSVLSNMVPVAS